MPVGEPAAEFLFELGDGGVVRGLGVGCGDLLDLRGEALDFLVLEVVAALGFLADGIGDAVDGFLKGFDAGFGGDEAVFDLTGRSGAAGDFQA